DEAPDQVLQLGARAVGDRRADGEVALPGEPGEVGVEAGQEGHEEARSLGEGDPVLAVDERLREGGDLPRAAEPPRRGPRAGGRPAGRAGAAPRRAPPASRRARPPGAAPRAGSAARPRSRRTGSTARAAARAARRGPPRRAPPARAPAPPSTRRR